MAEIVALEADGVVPFVTDQADAVLAIEFSAPPAHPLSSSTIALLREELARAAIDRQTKAIILRSTGKIFCAGHDLKEMRAHGSDDDGGKAFLDQLFADCSELMKAVVDHPKPVIAAVGGIATAAGCQLVASCDLAIASEQAQFCTPGVNLGGFCSTPMVALSRNVAPKHAMEMLLTGEMIDAQTARDFGLINRVVPPEYLNQVVKKYAETIASKSSSAIALGKRAFYKQLDMPLAEAYEFSSRVMVEGFMSRDSSEGVAACLEKRDPQWPEDAK